MSEKMRILPHGKIVSFGIKDDITRDIAGRLGDNDIALEKAIQDGTFVGADGADGVAGVAGAEGAAATIAVGSTTTLAPSTSATAVNSGTPAAAILDFGIPEGVAGTDGEDGMAVAGADKNTMFYDSTEWVANAILQWDKTAGTNGRLILDYSAAAVRAWNADMPGIVFKQPTGATLVPGLYLNLENNDAYGNRLDLGWGGANGGNFELYSKEHDVRPGQFRVVYGGGDFGHIQYTHYDGTNWYVTSGLTKDGRFFCGLKETGIPGSADCTNVALRTLPLLHPLEVFNETLATPDRIFWVEKTGAIWVKGSLATAPTDLPAISYKLWQDTSAGETGKVKLTVSDTAGTHVTHDLTAKELPLAGTTAQVLAKASDADGDTEWATPTPIDSGTATGQYAQWNGSKWVGVATTTVSVVTDMRVDLSGHKIEQEKKTITVFAAGSGAWTTITNGTLVAGKV